MKLISEYSKFSQKINKTKNQVVELITDLL